MATTERYSIRELEQQIYVIRDNLIEYEIEYQFKDEQEALYFLVILRRIDDEIQRCADNYPSKAGLLSLAS